MTKTESQTEDDPPKPTAGRPKPVPELGGRDGPEPTRYGDWEVGGVCTDF
jgi:hypothetical protein